MDARKQWHDDDECCDAVDESEEPSQPPRGVPDQRERRRVQQGEDLADVSAQDIMSAPYTLLMDKTRLMTDEIGWAMRE